jgi:hypothetical protein
VKGHDISNLAQGLTFKKWRIEARKAAEQLVMAVRDILGGPELRGWG